MKQQQETLGSWINLCKQNKHTQKYNNWIVSILLNQIHYANLLSNLDTN